VKERLQNILNSRRKQRIREPGRVCSAVLVPLFEQDGETWVLLVKRADAMRHHQGQIAFPGGTRESCDSTPADTALREAEEEVGLKVGDVTVIGELDDALTSTSNFTITPVVGYIPWPYTLELNAAEIAAAVPAPLSALRDPNQQQRETERVGESEIPVTEYQYREHRIWGATARILTQLLGLIDESSNTGDPA
jgi:8-oxo-dGTP pyrophosphatase MutT (NUDIX family)